MMLGRNYRFRVFNNTGAAFGVVINARRFKSASDGSITFESSEAEVFNEASISSSSTAWTPDTAIDNSTDKWQGGDFEITLTPAASATGTVVVQIEHSTDAGTSFGSGGQGVQIFGTYFNASSTAVTKVARVE